MKYVMSSLVLMMPLIATGCGSGTSTVGGPSAPDVLAVQLNANFNQGLASAKVIVTDSRKFTPPSSVSVVSGTPCGGPNTPNKLRAVLLVNSSPVAEYENANINAPFLTLFFSNVTPPIQINPGDEIEFKNLVGCGLMYEIHFNLVR
jgi:hypothetical protein